LTCAVCGRRGGDDENRRDERRSRKQRREDRKRERSPEKVEGQYHAGHAPPPPALPPLDHYGQVPAAEAAHAPEDYDPFAEEAPVDPPTDDEEEPKVGDPGFTIWQEFKDPKGKVYYHNTATQETTWEAPEEWLQAQAIVTARANGSWKENAPVGEKRDPAPNELKQSTLPEGPIAVKLKKKKEKKLPAVKPLSSLFATATKKEAQNNDNGDEDYDPFAETQKAKTITPQVPQQEAKSGWQPGMMMDLSAMVQEEVDELDAFDQAITAQATQDIKSAIKRSKLRVGKDISQAKMSRGGRATQTYGMNTNLG